MGRTCGDSPFLQTILIKSNIWGKKVCQKMLPSTPLFNMTFRYNAARALMMGMKQGGRQPLWMQRLRSTEMLSSLMKEENHPLIRETRRECLEDLWDLDGVFKILQGIRVGDITVREIHVDSPSPMSLPLRWQTEAMEMYAYAPSTETIRQTVYEELKDANLLKPTTEALVAKGWERRQLPEGPLQLHALLMMEGDLTAGELPVSVEWLDELAQESRACYIEPGLWIAAEKIQERYFLSSRKIEEILESLLAAQSIVEDEGIYYHGKLYDRAREYSIRTLRLQTVTQPFSKFAHYLAGKVDIHAPAEEQLHKILAQYCGRKYPVKFWETILFPRRIKNYGAPLLDKLLAQGDYFWQMSENGDLCFYRYEDIDWEASLPIATVPLEEEERLMYEELKKRGACFLRFLTGVPKHGNTQEILLSLAQKGLVCADSFIPVRQWMNQEKTRKATARQRVGARVMVLSAGRWDIVRPVKKKKFEDWIQTAFQDSGVLCRETFYKTMQPCGTSPYMEEKRIFYCWHVRCPVYSSGGL